MSTKREQILQAMQAALVGTTSVGTRIYRTRVTPVPREESPALIIEPIKDTPALETHLATIDWTFLVRVNVIVRGNIPDQVADPIVASLHSKLMASPTLGGLAIDILPAPTDFNFAEADGPAGEIHCDYRVLYRTSLANLET
jgi:hypothetical protein